jgi:hypothetical protein
MALVLSVESDAKNVRIDFPVPAGANRLTLSRAGPSGASATVRSWAAATVVPGAVIARDFEAPIGVALTYTADTWNEPGGAHTLETATITIPSTGCGDTWLTDLVRAANTQQIVIETMAELGYDVPATTHWILDRRPPIVSSDVAHTPSFELDFLTADEQEREFARSTLGNGVPVLLRTPPEDGIGNLYFSVLGFREQRLVTLGTQPARRFVVSGVQVERPDPALFGPLAPSTYQHAKDTFATYADMKAGRVSYDAVLYDWTGAEAQDVVPWPPTDV